MNTALTVQSGLGKGRDCMLIQREIRDKGLSMSGIARALDVHHSLVQSTVCGTRNNRKVLAYLLKIGVHPKQLFPMAYKAPEAFRPAIDRMRRDLAEQNVRVDDLFTERRAA